MKEFLERACLTHVSLSNVVGAHREALVKFLMSNAAADGVVENRMVTKGRPDPTARASTSSSGVVASSSFYTEEGEELSGSIDRILSLLLPTSDQGYSTSSRDTNRNEKPNFPFGIIGLLSVLSPYVSLVDSLAKSSTTTTSSSTIPSQQLQQQLPPSANQCLQFLQAVAIHEDAVYALWDTTREELGMLRPLRQQSKHSTTSPPIPSLPLECICISTIFSVLPKVAQYLVSTQGYTRQDIISSGIVTVMGRMAHFFGSSTRKTNMTSATEFTTILTPAHSNFVQLSLLSGQYQCAITFASSRRAILVPQSRTEPNTYDPSNATDTPVSPPLLIPLTVEHYLQYFYTLGNIYMLEDPRKYYQKALDMFTICMTTPTASSSSSSSTTPFHQRQPSATTPISSDSTSSKASSAIHPLQIAARKKQLLVSCLVACSHTSIVCTTSTTTNDSYLYHLPPMPLTKLLPTQGRTHNTQDMRNRSLSIPVTNDTYYSSTPIEDDVHTRTGPSALGQKQYYYHWESIPTALSSQQPNYDSTNLTQSPTSWPWSLPLYTSTSVYNTFFLDPAAQYTYYQQQQSSTKTNTTDGSSTHMPQQQQQQQQQQGSVLKSMLQELEQYNSLIAAYWFGDISTVRQISETFQDLFRYDGTYDLIVQLEESLTFRLIYTLANVYEAIPISMLVDYITLLDASITVHTLWKVLEKAKECNADFTFAMDQQHGYVQFFFHTVEEEEEQQQQYASSSDNTAFVSENIAAFLSLAERIQEMDISLATSKKYQAMARSKEPVTGTKQGTGTCGTTTKPQTRSASGGSISGTSAWI